METRSEYKYLLNRSTADILREKISSYLEPDEYGKGEPYIISSIYFDTKDRKLYRQTFDRVPIRYKLRLRVYGEHNDNDSPSFFEIKSKRHGLSSKRRLKLPLETNESLFENSTLPTLLPPDERLAKDILKLIQEDELLKASVVSYERLAFCQNDESRLRVTFDSKLRIRTTDLDLKNGAYGNPIMQDECVLEIKSCKPIPKWLKKTVLEYGLVNTSYSKYGKTDFSKNP